MEFNPDNDYAKHRDAQGGVWFIQNGRRYTVRGKPLPEEGAAVDEKTAAQKAVRQRASDKLAEYSGQHPSGSIADAYKENKKAEAAEQEAQLE